jgi:chromosome segregation ATPase
MQPEKIDVKQDIEKLRERHKSLEHQKITAEANLMTSEKTLNDLKRQARESYGTDDLDELGKKLDDMKQENETKRADYQQHLDEIEQKLKDINSQYESATKLEAPT